MNTKVILILFILLLNVAMIILINKKGTKDPLDGFFYSSTCNIDCRSIAHGNTEFCNSNNTSCRTKTINKDLDATPGQERPCKNLCKFNPLNRADIHDINAIPNHPYKKDGQPDPSVNNNCKYTDDTNCKKDTKCYSVFDGSNNFTKCLSRTGREANGKFEDEKLNGAYTSCFENCKTFWMNDYKFNSKSGDTFFTGCTTSDCVTRCTDYLLNKSNTDLTSYGPYPTNRIDTTDYEKLKNNFIDQLATNPALQAGIKNNLYQDEIQADSVNMDDIGSKNERLGEIMSTLKRLNNTGNNFLQQVDQLGEFQNKYSSRIDEILESRRSDPNNNFDTKIQNLSLKISNLNEIYNSFNDQYNIPNLDQAVLEPYKQISTTTGSGEVILNLTPVRYLVTKEGSEKSEQFYLKRKGAYLINGINEKDYLHYSKYMGIEGNRDIRDIPPEGIPVGKDEFYDKPSFELKYTNNQEEDYNLPQAFSDFFQLNNEDPPTEHNQLDVLTDDNRTGWSNLPKKDFYFYISRINNIQEYNAMFLKTQGESSLISSNSNIKFPFYIIESAKRPGYLLKVKDSSSGSNMELYVDKANNSPEEKFTDVGTTFAGNLCSTST